MYKIRGKIESSLDTKRSESSLLRLFRSTTGFQAFLISSERTDQEDVCDDSQKDTRNAMLEAEQKRAKAIMVIQQRRNFC